VSRSHDVTILGLQQHVQVRLISKASVAGPCARLRQCDWGGIDGMARTTSFAPRSSKTGEKGDADRSTGGTGGTVGLMAGWEERVISQKKAAS